MIHWEKMIKLKLVINYKIPQNKLMLLHYTLLAVLKVHVDFSFKIC